MKVNPDLKYTDTHKDFKKIALSKENLKWLIEEISICSPKLIITLGEVVARALANDNKTPNKVMLDGSVNLRSINLSSYNVAHLAHPEIYRINKDWKNITVKALKILGQYIIQNKLNA
jgi:uracil-DNA glycosylase